MNHPHTCITCRPAGSGATVPLASVAPELDRIESLEREVADLVTNLRATLPPDQFRLAWALRDAEERRGLVERQLAERQLVDGLARHLPVHAPAIRAAATHLLGSPDAEEGG